MKCQVCGEPIIAHKEVSHLYKFGKDYRCTKCGSLYEFHDHMAHYLFLFILLVMFVVTVKYLLDYDLARQLAAYIFGAYFFIFAHLYLRTKLIFSKVELITRKTEDESVLIKGDKYEE